MSNGSNALKKITPIKNILVEILDNNQNIKRYARYLTSKTPLDDEGISYNNNILEQPNLCETLTKPLRDNKDTEATSRGEILIPYMFDKDLLKEEKLLIFVHSPRSYADSRNCTVEHEFLITVAVNIDYNNIEPFGEERSIAVLCELLDEIEGKFVSEKYSKKIGIIQFETKRDRWTERISDKGFIASTIPISVIVANVKEKNRDYME
ncbi:MAG: hypothetical protein ACRCX8_18970 [Sarcina sp.]